MLTFLLILFAAVDRAAAFTCMLTCNFVIPDGIKSITCAQSVSGGAKDWYVCIRPAAGKSYGNLDSGSENCAKP